MNELRWRILDALASGSATANTLAIDFDVRVGLIEQELQALKCDGYVTSKPYVRYRRPVELFELAKTKKSAA